MLITDSIKPPRVSVILPVYNSEGYLRQCLDSLLAQTFDDIEIVCVNDGSTDKSLKIIEEYLKKDDRVKLVTQEHQGKASARNKGRYLARGEYICFMNSSDYAKPDMLDKLYKNAKEHEADISMCEVTLLDSKTMGFNDNSFSLELFSEDFNERSFSPKETYEFMFKINVNPINKLFRREFLEKNNAAFLKGLNYEEYLFFTQAYLTAENITLVRNPLIVHRINEKTSKKDDTKKLDLFSVMKLEKEFLLRKKLYKDLKYHFEKAKRNILVEFYKTIKSHRVKFIYRLKFFFEYPFQKIDTK